MYVLNTLSSVRWLPLTKNALHSPISIAKSHPYLVSSYFYAIPIFLIPFTSLLPFLWHYVPPMQSGLGVARLHKETESTETHGVFS